MTSRRRRPQGELRRFRKQVVAVLRDATPNAAAPAVVKTAGARNQHR